MLKQNRSVYLSTLMDMVASQANCVVNFEDVSGATQEIPTLKLAERQYYHHGPYCEFAKLSGNQPKCMEHKRTTLEQARLTKKAFGAPCPFGLWDYVYPVFIDNEMIGAIYLGSVRLNELQIIHGKVYKGPSIQKLDKSIQDRLAYYGEFLGTACNLIIRNWLADGNHLSKHRTPDFYKQTVETYLSAGYHTDMHLPDLARRLNVHPDYLGKIIKRLFGMSFRKLLTEYRIEKSCVLLALGSQSVTHIAYSCGFNDSNYFSTVFRNHKGMTPFAYKQAKSKKTYNQSE